MYTFTKAIKNLEVTVDVQKEALRFRLIFLTIDVLISSNTFVHPQPSYIVTVINELIRVCIWNLGIHKLEALRALMDWHEESISRTRSATNVEKSKNKTSQRKVQWFEFESYRKSQENWSRHLLGPMRIPWTIMTIKFDVHSVNLRHNSPNLYV